MGVKPSEKQLKFMDWEMGVFFHFGIRTFYEGHTDWDGHEAEMLASGFNPTDLDCEQWIRNVKEAGAKYAIMTAKHHDGFANWPSAYSDYCVRNTPYKDGKGDVVREFVDACRKYGVGVGLYYSPAQFGFTFVDPKEYDDYFINQITELLTNYGKIDYLWFDGCGSAGHEYDWARIIPEIRRLQPDILLFGGPDPDTAWIGNECGIVPFGQTYDGGSRFLPFECDCKMRRYNWFFSEKDEDCVRPLNDLVGLYYYSIGRGGNLLINIGPNREGKLPEKDCQALLSLKNEIDRRFADPIPYTMERKDKRITLILDHPQLVNHVVLSEDLTNGQKIRAFSIACEGDCPHMFDGKTVGHKQICVIPDYFCHLIHIDLTDADDDFALRDIRLFHV